MTHMDKLALMFPDFADLFKGIEEFFKEIEKTTTAMFHPSHHHHKQAAIEGKVEPKQHHDMFSQIFGHQQQHQNFDLFGSLFHPQPKAAVHTNGMQIPMQQPQHPEEIQFQDPFKALFGHPHKVVPQQNQPQFNFFE